MTSRLLPFAAIVAMFVFLVATAASVHSADIVGRYNPAATLNTSEVHQLTSE